MKFEILEDFQLIIEITDLGEILHTLSQSPIQSNYWSGDDLTAICDKYLNHRNYNHDTSCEGTSM